MTARMGPRSWSAMHLTGGVSDMLKRRLSYHAKHAPRALERRNNFGLLGQVGLHDLDTLVGLIRQEPRQEPSEFPNFKTSRTRALALAGLE